MTFADALNELAKAGRPVSAQSLDETLSTMGWLQGAATVDPFAEALDHLQAHLPGQHDQADHGNRGPSLAKPSQHNPDDIVVNDKGEELIKAPGSLGTFDKVGGKPQFPPLGFKVPLDDTGSNISKTAIYYTMKDAIESGTLTGLSKEEQVSVVMGRLKSYGVLNKTDAANAKAQAAVAKALEEKSLPNIVAPNVVDGDGDPVAPIVNGKLDASSFAASLKTEGGFDDDAKVAIAKDLHALTTGDKPPTGTMDSIAYHQIKAYIAGDEESAGVVANTLSKKFGTGTQEEQAQVKEALAQYKASVTGALVEVNPPPLPSWEMKFSDNGAIKPLSSLHNAATAHGADASTIIEAFPDVVKGQKELLAAGDYKGAVKAALGDDDSPEAKALTSYFETAAQHLPKGSTSNVAGAVSSTEHAVSTVISKNLDAQHGIAVSPSTVSEAQTLFDQGKSGAYVSDALGISTESANLIRSAHFGSAKVTSIVAGLSEKATASVAAAATHENANLNHAAKLAATEGSAVNKWMASEGAPGTSKKPGLAAAGKELAEQLGIPASETLTLLAALKYGPESDSFAKLKADATAAVQAQAKPTPLQQVVTDKVDAIVASDTPTPNLDKYVTNVGQGVPPGDFNAKFMKAVHEEYMAASGDSISDAKATLAIYAQGKALPSNAVPAPALFAGKTAKHSPLQQVVVDKVEALSTSEAINTPNLDAYVKGVQSGEDPKSYDKQFMSKVKAEYEGATGETKLDTNATLKAYAEAYAAKANSLFPGKAANPAAFAAKHSDKGPLSKDDIQKAVSHIETLKKSDGDVGNYLATGGDQKLQWAAQNIVKTQMPKLPSQDEYLKAVEQVKGVLKDFKAEAPATGAAKTVAKPAPTALKTPKGPVVVGIDEAKAGPGFKWVDNHKSVHKATKAASHLSESQKDVQATVSEKSALKAYQDGSYSAINQALRAGGDGGPKVAKLDQLISKHSLSEPIALNRGAGKISPSQFGLSSWEGAVGQTIQDKGFASFSTSGGFTNTGNGTVNFHIVAEPGTRGVSMNHLKGYSSTHKSEAEFLLPRGQKFQIIGYQRSATGSHHLYGRTVPDY